MLEFSIIQCIEIPKLSQSGQCKNFIFNFPVSYEFMTVFCALAPLYINCFICKTLDINYPQICIQTLRICLAVNNTAKLCCSFYAVTEYAIQNAPDIHG